MKPSIYQVDIGAPGALFVMPKPSGEWLAEDVESYREIGIDRIVSLLTDGEAKELGLSDEEIVCAANHIEFVRYPILDRGIPEGIGFSELAEQLADDVRRGRNVAIHCRAGIGRAGMLACCTLQILGFSPSSAVERVSLARGVIVPDTPEQLAFIESFRSAEVAKG